MNVMIRLIRFLRNFPWKQTHLVVLGFLIWIVTAPFLEKEERNEEETAFKRRERDKHDSME